ncbi:hypothetical protein MGN70_003469 [Eutypa lata]|nr:hypothetical protein MGN70_003469 [Eutypa lata]
MNDRLNHKQIMFGFEHNGVDPNDSIPIYVLKVLLRKNLESLSPVIQQRVKEGIQGHLLNSPQSGGCWTVSLFSLARAVSMRVTNQILFGDELGMNADFNRVSLRYAMDGATTMEACRLLPGFMAKFVGQGLMAWSGAMRQVGQHVTRLVDSRLSAGTDQLGEQLLDCTQFVIRVSRTEQQRSPTRIVQQMIALQFASAHQLPMALTWAIVMLCEHPEAKELLREEIQTAEDNYVNPLKELRLLDSFLRESSRLNPLDSCKSHVLQL